MNKVSKSNKKNFNKALATTAVLSMILAPNTVWGASSSDSSSFKDINQAAPWAKESVVKAKNLGFIGGDNNGNFHPLDMITRQEIASIISKFLKLPTPKVEKSSFKDVSASAWSKDAIEAVLKAGVMVGDNGNFRPEAPITREELAAVLVSTVKLDTTGKGNNIKTADKALVSEWARPAVQTSIEFGLLKGDGTNFLPKKKAQRQEVAAVAVNLVNVVLHPVSGKAKIENVTEGSATIGGVQYKVADAVKGILNKNNSEVLQGANITFETADKTINKITYLELTKSGKAAASGEKEFAGNLVLDGRGAAVDGNVKVGADYISLKNLTVNGNFEIGKETQNDFYSDKLNVKGNTLVNGGDSNTVVFENAALGNVEVNKQDVHVDVKGTTKLSQVTISSNANLTADAGLVIPKVAVKEGAEKVGINATVTSLAIDSTKSVELAGKAEIASLKVEGKGQVNLKTTGTIDKLEVANKDSKLTVPAGLKIANLVVPEGAKVQDLVANYDQVKGQITNVNNGTATPVPTTPTVPAGGGAGGVVVSDTTAPTVEEASGIIGGQEVRASRSGNTFTISLAGFSDDKMFTGLKFKVSENSTISFSVLFLGPKSKELTQGDNIVSVKDLLGDLDSGEPGVSIGKAKEFLGGELSGTLTDKAGNKTDVTIVLKD
ncbi:S-layer homology domain-containing protein [Aneurinibacillus tyrosinisolvens]|uniref:S-layer homology domain-containing protein n=1 Tax=Aneurinibacillus tyrosinisolvens TaxID=1443435 RepID=UPI00069B3888|nr:S-layer homology domain-containing protein [Aneurinibacillus tyrosinisolvens]